jgi:hypothetical protein
MRQHVAKLTPALFLVGGCSLIYNPSNIDKPPVDASGPDMGIDAAPIYDANPSLLTVEDVAPKTLFEGQGEGGSRTAVLVIYGHHFTSDGISVEITPSDGLTVGTPMVSQYGDHIAVPVTVALDPMKSTELVDLTVSVTENGAPAPVMLADKLKLQYLPELITGTSIDGANLAPLYSQVMLGNVTCTGTMPVVVRAVSSIEIGTIASNGAAGSRGENGGGAAAPGGCAGGGAGDAGGCSGFDGGGGGAAGNTSGGGGGGGFGSEGAVGNGNGGVKGAAHGNDQVVNLLAGPTTTNRSGGGGGGGAGTLAGAGAGGGGGGTVVLVAGGNITTGAISADGGGGGSGSGGLANGAGGGGGGSGGLVIVRSHAGALSVASISAVGGPGGAGGAGTLGGNGGSGGTGGIGRVRLDAPGSIPSGSSPQAHRGPSFDAATSTISTTANPTLMLVGAENDQLDGYLLDAEGVPHFGEPMDQKIVNGMLTVTPTLLPGYNKLCFTNEPGMRGDELADTCIEIAYLP